VFGYLTHRLGLSPIVGYLLAGTLVGPYTPGFVADAALAEELAEITCTHRPVTSRSAGWWSRISLPCWRW
jgi:hypothetical protein